ncbi:MAG: hypothetical protein WCJ92_02120 [Alphaproteobacteria bacterium]
MKYFKKLMLVALLSNFMIFAEDKSLFDDSYLIKRAASSNFVSQQLPAFFGYASFSYGSVFGVLYFMYETVSESFYARVMSLSFGRRPANIKRTGGNLHLPDLDTNVLTLTLTLPEDCSRQPTLSPCFFIGSPLSSPPSSPQRPGVRKRALSNSYMTNVDLLKQ